jgi:hypothetical protein
MSDLGSGERLELRVIHEPELVHRLAWGFGVVGTVAGVVGVLLGLVMALHRIVVSCPDGHFTPTGGDPNCYSYPNAGLGTSIALISLSLSMLILLVVTMLLLQEASRRRRL